MGSKQSSLSLSVSDVHSHLSSLEADSSNESLNISWKLISNSTAVFDENFEASQYWKSSEDIFNSSTNDSTLPYKFKRMDSPLDFFLFFYYFGLAFYSNCLARILWDSYRQIKRRDRTILNYLMKDYVTMNNRQVNFVSFIMMGRLLVFPLSYPLALVVHMAMNIIYTFSAICILYLFIIKLILIRKPGLIESADSQRLRLVLKSVAYMVGIIIDAFIGINCLAFDKRYNSPIMLYFIDGDVDGQLVKNNVPILLIAVACLTLVTMAVASYEAYLNYDVINTRNLKRIVAMEVIMISGIVWANFNWDKLEVINNVPLSNILGPTTLVFILVAFVYTNKQRNKRIKPENDELPLVTSRVSPGGSPRANDVAKDDSTEHSAEHEMSEARREVVHPEDEHQPEDSGHSSVVGDAYFCIEDDLSTGNVIDNCDMESKNPQNFAFHLSVKVDDHVQQGHGRDCPDEEPEAQVQPEAKKQDGSVNSDS